MGGGDGGGGGSEGGGDGQPTVTPPDSHPLFEYHHVPAASGHCAARSSQLDSAALPLV